MPATYKILGSVTTTSNSLSLTFSSIPQTYTDLVIRGSSRSATAGSNGEIVLLLNGSNATTYSNTKVYGADTTVSSNYESNSARIEMFVNAASNSTTNVFSSHEIYIPSYASSTNKPVSIFSNLVQNNTEGTSYLAAIAGLRSNTAAITSVTILPTGGFAAGSTFYLYGIEKFGTSGSGTATSADVVAKATGGTITTDGTYVYHSFTSTGTFATSQTLTVDVAMVGGGGGGAGAAAGQNFGGGGGGGSVGIRSGWSLSAGNYSAVIGGGGTGGASGDNNGSQGTASSFNAITANGGGGGGRSVASGTTGGSSGGSGDRSSPPASATPGSSSGWTFYANAGAGSASTANGSGGGGGAGANDALATGNSASQGYRSGGSALSVGTYLSNWGLGAIGSSLGAGGGGNSPTIGGGGGTGGGSGGDYGGGTNNTAGAANYGAGGGGTGGSSPSGTLSSKPGKAGGSGIVVVRYAI